MVVWEPCACLDKIDFDSVTNRVDKIDRVDCKSTAWLCAVDFVQASTGFPHYHDPHIFQHSRLVSFSGCVLDTAEYSAFDSTLNSILSYRQCVRGITIVQQGTVAEVNHQLTAAVELLAVVWSNLWKRLRPLLSLFQAKLKLYRFFVWLFFLCFVPACVMYCVNFVYKDFCFCLGLIIRIIVSQQLNTLDSALQ